LCNSCLIRCWLVGTAFRQQIANEAFRIPYLFWGGGQRVIADLLTEPVSQGSGFPKEKRFEFLDQKHDFYQTSGIEPCGLCQPPAALFFVVNAVRAIEIKHPQDGSVLESCTAEKPFKVLFHTWPFTSSLGAKNLYIKTSMQLMENPTNEQRNGFEVTVAFDNGKQPNHCGVVSGCNPSANMYSCSDINRLFTDSTCVLLMREMRVSPSVIHATRI